MKQTNGPGGENPVDTQTEGHEEKKKKKRWIILFVLLAAGLVLILLFVVPGAPMDPVETQAPDTSPPQAAQTDAGDAAEGDAPHQGAEELAAGQPEKSGAQMPAATHTRGGKTTPESDQPARPTPAQPTPPRPTPPQPTPPQPTPPQPTPTQKVEEGVTLRVVTPGVVSKAGGIFTVDLQMNALPDRLYPAASVLLDFDASKLELVGVQKGTMQAYDNYVAGSGSPGYMVPLWTCDVSTGNATGTVRAIYVDMSGGKNAYCASGFSEGSRDVLLRIQFRLKDTAVAGDQIAFAVRDFVFATSLGDQNGGSLTAGAAGGNMALVNGSVQVVWAKYDSHLKQLYGQDPALLGA